MQSNVSMGTRISKRGSDAGVKGGDQFLKTNGSRNHMTRTDIAEGAGSISQMRESLKRAAKARKGI